MVVEGHDLLQHEVGLLDHVLIDDSLEAELVLHVGHSCEQVALAVGANSGTEAGVDDLCASLGGRAGSGHEEAVGGVAVEVQDKVGPALLQGSDQLGGYLQAHRVGGKRGRQVDDAFSLVAYLLDGRRLPRAQRNRRLLDEVRKDRRYGASDGGSAPEWRHHLHKPRSEARGGSRP